MRYKLALVIGVILVCAAVALLDYTHGVSEREDQPKNVELVVQPAPDFSFQLVDNQKTYTLSDFKDKTIMINFWASWCIPCLYEFPILVELASQHPEDFVLIMLSGDKTAEQAYEFARGFCIQRGMFNEDTGKLFPKDPNIYIAWDKDKHIARELFQTVRYPESIIITPDLMMKEKIAGVLTDDNIARIKASLQQQ